MRFESEFQSFTDKRFYIFYNNKLRYNYRKL